jgi:hypothetical protein
MMLADEMSVMDERFAGNLIAVLPDVTRWKSDINRIYVEPPRVLSRS